MAESRNCPIIFGKNLPIEFKICEIICGIYSKVNLWPHVNWALLRINMAESRNCPIIFGKNLPIEFKVKVKFSPLQALEALRVVRG
jgi:hypothetical protein